MRNSVAGDAELDGLPGHALLRVIGLPKSPPKNPWRLILQRLSYATTLMLIAALVVYFDRGGY